MILFFATAAVVLVPVSGDSAGLQDSDTFVSEIARAEISERPTTVLQCMAMPEARSHINRICLTAGEWEAVSEKIETDASIERRERALRLTQWQGHSFSD